MPKTWKETEFKFPVQSFTRIKKLLKKLKAKRLGKEFEYNELFDFSDKRLRKKKQVIRLRKAGKNFLTFKGKTIHHNTLRVREERELEIEDFYIMKFVLEKLGLKKWFAYEKYRETFYLNGAEIVLDELPFGKFIEIEGSKSMVLKIAKSLEMDLKTALKNNYLELWQQICLKEKKKFSDLLFK